MAEERGRTVTSIDGFYRGYFTGVQGNGVALFVLKNGILVGSDVFGVSFDGSYVTDPSGGAVTGTVTVTAPPNATLVQGVMSGPHGMSYEVQFSLPSNFQEQPYIRLVTPLGPVNVSLELLRSVD